MRYSMLVDFDWIVSPSVILVVSATAVAAEPKTFEGIMENHADLGLLLDTIAQSKRDCSCLDEFEEKACVDERNSALDTLKMKFTASLPIGEESVAVKLGKYDFKKHVFPATLGGGVVRSVPFNTCAGKLKASDPCANFDGVMVEPPPAQVVVYVKNPAWTGQISVEDEDEAKKVRDAAGDSYLIKGELVLKIDAVSLAIKDNPQLTAKKRIFLAAFDDALKRKASRMGPDELAQYRDQRKCHAKVPTQDVTVTVSASVVGVRMEASAFPEYLVSAPPTAEGRSARAQREAAEAARAAAQQAEEVRIAREAAEKAKAEADVARRRRSEAAAAHGSNCPDDTVLVPGMPEFVGNSRGQRVKLKAFCMDRSEVTVAKYAACVSSGDCTPAAKTAFSQGAAQSDLAFGSKFCNGDKQSFASHPVNCIDWSQASAYCKTLGRRLPSADQWFWAAGGRGQDRKFPWGNNPPEAKRLNACGSECVDLMKKEGKTGKPLFGESDAFATTAPVGSFAGGDSRDGIHDLAGNVMEWTSTKQDDLGYLLKGGGWQADEAAAVAAAWAGAAPASSRDSDAGFRCVADAPPPASEPEEDAAARSCYARAEDQVLKKCRNQCGITARLRTKPTEEECAQECETQPDTRVFLDVCMGREGYPNHEWPEIQ